MILQLPDTAYLRECFTYNRKTGALRWRRRPREHFSSEREWRRQSWRRGTIAGYIDPQGYRIVVIDQQAYKGSRIIWKLQTGTDPSAEIDHKNRDRSDNRWRNLRPATSQQNRFNRPGWTDLPKGVHRHGTKYTSRPYIDGRLGYLGSFDTPEEAHAAYVAYTRPLHGAFFFKE